MKESDLPSAGPEGGWQERCPRSVWAQDLLISEDQCRFTTHHFDLMQTAGPLCCINEQQAQRARERERESEYV